MTDGDRGHEAFTHRNDCDVVIRRATPQFSVLHDPNAPLIPEHGNNTLDAVLEAHISRVDKRVASGHDLYAEERTEVRTAARQVHDMRRRLDLGNFLGPVGYAKSKPQFLLLFNSSRGPVVLKTYGKVRPGEARVQQLWRGHGVRVVNVLDAGDDPASWLLMELLKVAPVAKVSLTGVELADATAELAALMASAHSVGSTRLADESAFDAGLTPLDEAITTHLGGVLSSLRRHRYPVREDWSVQIRRLCVSERPTLLHGDLGGGNVVRQATDGQLWILDTCGYVGPPEFDAARWAARAGHVVESEDVLSGWLASEPGLNEPLARALLGLELLMEAGVRELVKDEQHQDLGYPDDLTEQLLEKANELLDSTSRQAR